MKTETKAPEKKLLHFDESNFNRVKNILTLLVEMINEKPIPTNDAMSIRALERNGLKNDSFLSLCEEVGIIPDKDFFLSVLKNGVSPISEHLIKDVAPALKEVVKISHEPTLKRFSLVLNQIKNRLANEQHHTWIYAQKVIQFEKFISFVGGRSVVEPLESIKEGFRTYVDSEAKAKALELLEEIAYLTNLLRKLQTDKNLIPYSLDFNWFMEDPAGKITPNPEIIKYC
jgi:hypothetical protein